MIPFNLERALGGERVITRNGEEVTGLHHFKKVASEYSLFGVVNGKVTGFTVNGEILVDMHHEMNLCMAPPDEWINLYWDLNAKETFVSDSYATRELAKENKAKLSCLRYLGTFAVEAWHTKTGTQ